MSWSVTDLLFLFLFVYAASGIPLGDEPRPETLRLTSQWGKDSVNAHQWPNGVVPYVIDMNSYDDVIKAQVHFAMAMLHQDACIRFKRLRKGRRVGAWIHFTNPNALRRCFHEPIYKADGEIQVVLGYDCLRQQDIMHSLLHGIGFKDEVSHPQRDLYVKVMWTNIQPAYRSMFRIHPVEYAGGLMEYDTMSIMHFHDRAYSLNGQATITPLLPGLKIAPSNSLSHLDKVKLRIMFGHECNKRKVGEVLNKCKGILSRYDQSELTPTQNAEDPQNIDDENDDLSGNEDEGLLNNDNGQQEVLDEGNPKDEEVQDNENENAGANTLDDVNEDETLISEESIANNEKLVVEDNGNSDDGVYLNDNIHYNTAGKVDNEVIIVGNDNINDNKATKVDDEVIIVGNDNINDNKATKADDEVIIIGNDNIKDNKATKADDEVIIVGNDKINDNKSTKADGEVIIVGNDKINDNKSTKADGEVIIVGNDIKDNKATKADDEVIIVGNDKIIATKADGEIDYEFTTMWNVGGWP